MTKKKVLIATFGAECNEHVDHQADLGEFQLLYGQESIDATKVKDIFHDADMELIPSIHATTSPTGMIKKEAFDYIADSMLEAIEKNMGDFDGIYLQWHGASGILDLPEVSGEHYLIKEIRKIVGKHLPIALVMDPHGNVTHDLTKHCNIVRTYRESPHSDTIETRRIVASKLVNLLNNRRTMKPLIKKIPIMVDGERSISAYEPMKSINRLMDEAEEDPRIFSLSYFVGFMRHDDDKLGAAVVAVPNETKDIAYTEEVMEEIAEYAWEHRHEFTFKGNYGEPDESVRKALDFDGKTAVITDSGDNCGAGSQGKNTVILREFLKQNPENKKVLIAGLNDRGSHAKLSNHEIGDQLTLRIGEHIDKYSAPVEAKIELKQIGDAMYGNHHTDGKVYTVNIVGSPIDIIIMNVNVQYGQMQQYHAAGLDFHDYEIVVVKMGYLDTALIPETAYHNMALTGGPTTQRFKTLNIKQMARPMWPLDEMDELEYILND
ncbi:MAG: M81 family metallopeptidase [Atopostipes sp.]|nr:M81 family metallopeptidase [Staphylococcus equorum]MDN6161300.1 M81 family metallopeptidase [Atopostipes sp.]